MRHPFWKGVYFDGKKWQARLKSKPRKGLCNSLYCRHTIPSKERKCSKCKMRLWRLNNPAKAYLAWIKVSAKKRNLEFNLTIDDILKLPNIDDYLSQFVSDPKSLHMDRINPRLGYTPGNIRIIDPSANMSKAIDDKWDRWAEATEKEDEYNPF